MAKQIINPEQSAPPRGFNHGFLCSGGQTLFLAGQDASDRHGQIVGAGDLVAQYEQVLANIQAVVTEAGGSMTDVVKINIFVSDRDDYVAKLRPLGAVHRQYFGRHFPATALFEISRFFQTEALIELEGFAYIESGRRMMQFELTAEQKAVQRRARHFALEEVLPLARETDESGEFPLHLIPRLGELGFLAGTIAPDYGGSGMDYLSYTLISEELGRVDSSVRGFLAVHGSLVIQCLNDWGSEAQKQTYIPRLATGEWIGCYCLTEPDAGSDVASMTSTARDEGDTFVINGTKHWITNGGIADIALVFATVDPALRHKGICAFIVETNADGFERRPMGGQELGHRSSDHAFITFNELRVPRENLLGGVGEGFKVGMSALDHGRLGVAAGAVGIAQGCLDASVSFARNRRQFGQRIADFQMIQANIADMSAAIEAARLLVYKAAWLKENGYPTTRATSTAKLFATEMACQAAADAVLLHGGRGYSSEFPVERFYRDIKGLQIYEGSSHIQRIVIARDVIGRE